MIERLRYRVPAGAAGDFFFFSPELTLCADSYSVSVPPRVTVEARKRPRSFCQKCRWQVTPLTQRNQSGLTMLSRHSVGTYQGNELTRNPAGIIRPESSQLPELLWTDLGLNKSNSCARADLHLRKKQKSTSAGGKIDHPALPENRRNRRRSHLTIPVSFQFRLQGHSWSQEF